jgi:hypothetical protein
MELPLRHLSIRVPWHDTGWDGRVCRDPLGNSDCLVLSRIGQRRDDELEASLTGRSWEDLTDSQLPACANERASFMSTFEFTKQIEHPYASWSAAHKHFLPTQLRFPEYTAMCIPYWWMLREGAEEITEQLDLPYSTEAEESVNEVIGNTSWVQTAENQRLMLDTFFSAVRPERSLCFFYVKRMPLTDDANRVLVGIGRALTVGGVTEYEHNGEGDLRSVLWERPIGHSIRPGFEDGFLFPYHQLLELAEEDPDLHLGDHVAFAPEGAFDQFSFASQHVTHDSAIGALLEAERVIGGVSGLVDGDWDHVSSWISARLGEIWAMRGPYPGLGSALEAFGVPNAHLLTYRLANEVDDNADPWPTVDALFADPGRFGMDGKIGPALRATWRGLPEERLALLKLLARFEITGDQATRFFVTSERADAGIDVSDADLLANPYLLYELDRTAVEPIAVEVVDRGAFPDPIVRSAHPMPPPSAMEEDVDARRFRALAVSVLEQRAVEGHTLRTRDDVVTSIRDLPISPACPVTPDIASAVADALDPVIDRVEMADGAPAYKLRWLSDAREQVRKVVEQRAKAPSLEVSVDWATALDDSLGGRADPGDTEELRAREEKVAALGVLATSRLSVLIGAAGTGKTTVLSALTSEPAIAKGGVLLLAPTGKARVRMEQAIRATGAPATAFTIAQFLLKWDAYDYETSRYRLLPEARFEGAGTVVIDESSMLTEDALAAIFSACRGVERYILVGDPRQLPPIGAGRPFVDVVERLKPEDVEGAFPRVGPGYADLTILRRHVAEGHGEDDRRDLALASWFSGASPAPGADEVWDALQRGEDTPHLRFVSWSTDDDLRSKLLHVIVEELELDGIDDESGFERTIGGTPFKGAQRNFFWAGKGDEPGAAAMAEAWQILSPVRATGHGVVELNRAIQRQFRGGWVEAAQLPIYSRKVPELVGPERLVYGDKVIQVTNQRLHDVWPKDEALQYVANGEIGIVVGQYKTKNFKKAPWKLEVEFSSQSGFKYGYGRGWFSDDAGSPPLELAYALTVHKAQGSEFRRTFLVIPEPAWNLTRELMYTALTRQRERVVVLYQGEPLGLLKYAAPHLSETAARLTDLFEPPLQVEIEHRYLQERLIHQTRRKDAVRSKSEVIIADLLYSKGIEYTYERPLVAPDGSSRLPDFTIEDFDRGRTVYWEHLGMLSNPRYEESWRRKAAWYADQGISRWPEVDADATKMLLVTVDDQRGAIDSAEIEELLDEVLA